MNRIRDHLLFQLVSWFIAYNFLGIITHLVLRGVKSENPDIIVPSLNSSILWSSAGAILIGTMLGIVDFYFKSWERKLRSFSEVILFKTFLYILLIIAAIISGNLINLIINPDTNFWANVFSWQFLVIFVYSLGAALIISFISQVSKKFGQHELWSVITGKYFRPREEQRIFMFLDLRSSTRYAEQLGHIRYSQLIQKCFYYINRAVPDYNAGLYQYVGDEAVLTWSWDDGIHNNKCIEFYLGFKKLVRSKSKQFIKEFGFVPEFKAGIHGGTVTVAEVGDIKREISYHGDVVNTAARIQSQCNPLKRTLLVSEELIDSLDVGSLSVEKMGEVSLRGKKRSVMIYSLASPHEED